jgi:branched-chain amino acid transport system substrate-binding protein
MTHSPRTYLVVAVAAMSLAAAACSSSKSPSGTGSAPAGSGSGAALPAVDQNFSSKVPLTASGPGVTPTTIKIGYITEQTGVAASSFAGGDAGALARFKLQNDQGGVDGRKLELVAVDDGTIGPKAAAQQLVENDGVLAVIDFSSFAIGGAPYLQQQGVPVIGAAFDGPEWGEQPYSNMFSFMPPLDTSVGGKFYTYDTPEIFLKSIGVTKLGTLAYGISQSAIQTSKSAVEAGKAHGITGCAADNSVQFGQSSFATEALTIRSKGCNGTFAAMVDSSDVALSAALKQAGVTAKQFYETGYDQGVISDANSANALNGDYFPAPYDFTEPSPAISSMLAALHRYGPTFTGLPSEGVYGSYLAADLVIKGLEVAGANPTRQSYISNLHTVTGYTAGGIIPAIGFTGFATVGMFPQQNCSDFVQLVNGRFKVAGKHVCGKLVATS